MQSLRGGFERGGRRAEMYVVGEGAWDYRCPAVVNLATDEASNEAPEN
jgi:hypothetical protein